ncbi:DUF465 domain-containing protein [Sphingomonas jatrophae]|uniref:DUF465 domain-containing protein n=1 Tax=Sphingomonas jatrophae TaxID=1166337 RepID=A0A1I6M0K2_9SPHN|nr:DUF465 domain-containing protein [Sphingomonas jatrophae]SFS09227.1 Protein of unknown function [Sphingomonas jatrophae]
MSNRYLDYLKREHARLEADIARHHAARFPDNREIARLKKLKLALKDQLAELNRDVAVAA